MGWGNDRLRDDVEMSLSFEPTNLDLRTVALGLSALDRLWGNAIQLDAYRQMTETIPDGRSAVRPDVVDLHRGSLMIELASGGTAAAGFGMTFWFFRWMVLHPQEIGGFIPRIIEGWRSGWHAADAAERDRQLAAAQEHESRGEPDGATSLDPVARLARTANSNGRMLASSLGVPDVMVRAAGLGDSEPAELTSQEPPGPEFNPPSG